MNVTKEPGTVQRVKPGGCEPRRVPDVMQDRGRDQKLGIAPEYVCEAGSTLSNTERVLPSAPERLGEFLLGQ